MTRTIAAMLVLLLYFACENYLSPVAEMTVFKSQPPLLKELPSDEVVDAFEWFETLDFTIPKEARFVLVDLLVEDPKTKVVTEVKAYEQGYLLYNEAMYARVFVMAFLTWSTRYNDLVG